MTCPLNMHQKKKAKLMQYLYINYKHKNHIYLKQKNQAKPEKTKSNWFELFFILKNRIETGQFEPVLFFKKI